MKWSFILITVYTKEMKEELNFFKIEIHPM